MTKLQKAWLEAVPWETVLTVNQALCQAQQTVCRPKDKTYESARQLWEKSSARTMSLPEVLEICRRCQDLGPFIFSNGNTFAAIGKTLVEDWVKTLPPVEAQIVRTTVGHYIAGLIGKKELLEVLRHFEPKWNIAEAGKSGRQDQPANVVMGRLTPIGKNDTDNAPPPRPTNS